MNVTYPNDVQRGESSPNIFSFTPSLLTSTSSLALFFFQVLPGGVEWSRLNTSNPRHGGGRRVWFAFVPSQRTKSPPLSRVCLPFFDVMCAWGSSCARGDTIAPKIPSRPRFGAQLARLARWQEWGTNPVAGSASRDTFACPGTMCVCIRVGVPCRVF